MPSCHCDTGEGRRSSPPQSVTVTAAASSGDNQDGHRRFEPKGRWTWEHRIKATRTAGPAEAIQNSTGTSPQGPTASQEAGGGQSQGSGETGSLCPGGRLRQDPHTGCSALNQKQTKARGAGSKRKTCPPRGRRVPAGVARGPACAPKLRRLKHIVEAHRKEHLR